MRSERALAEPSAARDRLLPGIRVRRDMRDRLAACLPAARRRPSAGRHPSRDTGRSHDALFSAADLPHRRSSTLAACLPAARCRPSVGRHSGWGAGRFHDGLFSAADLPQRRSVLGYRSVSGRIATGRLPATARPAWARPAPATDPGHPPSRGSNGRSPTAEARSAGSRGSAGRRRSGLPPAMARRSNSGAQALAGGNRRTRDLRGGVRLRRAVTRFPRGDRGAARRDCGTPAGVQDVPSARCDKNVVRPDSHGLVARPPGVASCPRIVDIAAESSRPQTDFRPGSNDCRREDCGAAAPGVRSADAVRSAPGRSTELGPRNVRRGVVPHDREERSGTACQSGGLGQRRRVRGRSAEVAAVANAC